jgi:hypothetical protein
MLFRFLRPNPDGTVADIAIEADNLHVAFRRFARNHWHAESPSVGVWQGGRIVAHVFTGFGPDWKTLLPLYNRIEIPPYGQGVVVAEPSEN